MNPQEMPQGLSAALGRYPDAMSRFSDMPEDRRRSVIEQARTARTETEMQALVDSLMR